MDGEKLSLVRDFRLYVALVCLAMLVKMTFEVYP